MKVIAFLTDFGLSDAYVGQMKGVALRICPEAKLADITHGIPKYNVLWGAHILRISRRYFPKGTVFVGVVDPGVGSERKAVAIVGEEGNVYVGPDNGLLYPSAAEEGIKAVYELNPEKAGLPEIAHTFHGRDLFTPAAALIACGVNPASIGRRLSADDLVKLPKIPRKPKVMGEAVRARVVYVDGFGNIITDMGTSELRNYLGVKLGGIVQISFDGGRTWVSVKYGRTFSDVPEGSLVLYEGSHGLIEIAVNRGNAALALNPARDVLMKKAAKQLNR
ncbi:MAG: S-adenosyl-l-methionine hydroxide adenosyltransferase family protein [Desulfurococcales archaeon]|nr:S-adenosyl-l-methionine hydroxide adenosyltransferase family protein [Desulfurococcales archaeon]